MSDFDHVSQAEMAKAQWSRSTDAGGDLQDGLRRLQSEIGELVMDTRGSSAERALTEAEDMVGDCSRPVEAAQEGIDQVSRLIDQISYQENLQEVSENVELRAFDGALEDASRLARRPQGNLEEVNEILRRVEAAFEDSNQYDAKDRVSSIRRQAENLGDEFSEWGRSISVSGSIVQDELINPVRKGINELEEQNLEQDGHAADQPSLDPLPAAEAAGPVGPPPVIDHVATDHEHSIQDTEISAPAARQWTTEFGL